MFVEGNSLFQIHCITSVMLCILYFRLGITAAEASLSLLLLYCIVYGFGQGWNDSRLCSWHFRFKNKAQIESRSLSAPASTISDTHEALDPPVVQLDATGPLVRAELAGISIPTSYKNLSYSF